MADGDRTGEVEVDVQVSKRVVASASTSRPSTPRRRFKRLIVACDGTWLDADNGLKNGKLALPSNVTRITRAIRTESRDGIPQVIFYQAGVGTEGGIVSRVVGGATGYGLEENVREAYAYVANNYAIGDELFFFGFSRGAFTARSVAGVIGGIGVLTKDGLDSFSVIFRDYQNRHDRHYRSPWPNVPFPNKPRHFNNEYARELERRGLTTLGVPIKVVGVWDTVGSLGIPRIGLLEKLPQRDMAEYAFYDTSLANCIENAFQALALDEKRQAFQPTVWEKLRGNETTLRQVWFPGVHSNIGGGQDDQQLANITLAWMMAQVEPFLDMDLNYIIKQHKLNQIQYAELGERPRPWSFGKIYDSVRGVYVLGGLVTRTPGEYFVVDPDTGLPTDVPLRRTHEYIHPSVRSRIMLEGPGYADKGAYDPPAMDPWLLIGKRSNPGAGPDSWFWEHRKSSSPPPQDVLPEAPLLGVERWLLSYSPEIEEYVLGAPRRPTRREIEDLPYR